MTSRNSQLVCQYLENISRTMLEEYQVVIRRYVRGRNGVYALYRRGKLYYVGLASSLLGRLKHHLKDRHAGTWDRFSVYLTIGSNHMKEIESLLLRVANPPGNKVRGKFARCENLFRKVKAEYRHLRQQEEREIFQPDWRKKGRDHKKPPKPPARKGRVPPLARFADQVKVLRGSFKGKVIRASVRKSGRIHMKGKIFNSPSDAARVACGRGTCNGWRFWTYERAPGDWVLLNELRRYPHARGTPGPHRI